MEWAADWNPSAAMTRVVAANDGRISRRLVMIAIGIALAGPDGPVIDRSRPVLVVEELVSALPLPVVAIPAGLALSTSRKAVRLEVAIWATLGSKRNRTEHWADQVVEVAGDSVREDDTEVVQ